MYKKMGTTVVSFAFGPIKKDEKGAVF